MFFKKKTTNQDAETNKFYGALKAKVDATVSKLFARMTELRKQINTAEKKLSREVDEAKNWSKRIAKLKEVAGERIIESDTSYEKYKVELRKLHEKETVSGEIIEALRDDFIPKLKSKYDQVHLEFLEKLDKVAADLRYVGVDATETIAKEVMRNFDIFITEQQSFTSAWKRIYESYGEDFLGMYGASFTIPAILPRSITSENISYVQKLFEPERATLNHPLQTRPADPIVIETPVEEKPVDEKPIETSEPAETKPKYKRNCSMCCEEFQTPDADVKLCPKCTEIEANRLELVATTESEATTEGSLQENE